MCVNLKPFVTAISLVLLLSACSVQTEPLSEAELALTVEEKLSSVAMEQELVTRPISLYEAMARALKYNLDHKVELYTAELASQKVNLARSDMLPDLVANAHYSNRNNDPFSFSRSITGAPSTNPSVSREKENLNSDLTFSWHILDFGLSYVRAKQAADKALIAEEQRRRVLGKVIEEVRTAYWRAVTADRLLSGFGRLESRINRALSDSGALRNEGFTSPISAMIFQRELLDIKRQIQQLQRELTNAKIELAALMNLGPSKPYKLVVPERKLGAVSLKIASEDMTRLALLNRSEVRELAYTSRIDALEAEAALLELLPGIQLYSGLNFDTNDYLLNNNWVSWGAKASWNVMRVFAYPVRKRLHEAEANLTYHRSIAMTMAVMTQVEVARANYAFSRKQAQTASQYRKVQRDILRQVRAEAQADATSEQLLIREEMNDLIASAQLDIAYADLQKAFATIYSSIGIDPYGEEIDTSASVSEIADQLRRTWQERGDVSS